ncbi:tyrosine-type recombinase/integrase [Aquimarina sp. U1-2]|uniref:tyrosine-type recombinase/integrase n=1 Tax=Aquimarina sp. U1-2 TaxID=2823141 RepID=UPI001AED0595|nr:tyrosine-type recombinase/integrase [Aquimarina sp. U1-2]MBP2834241.1 tyrosine-type recombinase/integrase [Aquimarina sp. U1-2]
MKKLKLENPSYRALLSNFKEWLDILGYVEKTVYNFPILVQEFLYWMEQHNINRIDLIHTRHVKSYYEYLRTRPNQRRGGGLSKSHLNKHQVALRKFKEYLEKHKATQLTLGLRTEKIDQLDGVTVLTIEEVKELFEVTELHFYNGVKLRDQTILVLLYSCGLRRGEAAAVNKSDIYFDKKLLHVRKGKNFKERLIPLNHHSITILENYIYEARREYIKGEESEALLLNEHGKRLRGANIAIHLKKLAKATENKEIIAKNITPHILRHSIATHLLRQGMDIEDIQQFLGHSHLETTQIYTHLAERDL